jgi:ClpP class serine protease
VSPFEIFWLIFLVSAFLPVFQRKRLDANRLKMIRTLEKKRKSRVISLIHRQETMSFLGIPIFRYIDINDSEQIMRAIRLTDDQVPIDLILHTPGGLVLAAEQIALAIKNHPARVTVFIPHYAMSGGTLIALAAEDIFMDENAVLGPVDPQLGEYPAASILKAVARKDNNKVEDRTLILADVAKKAISQLENCIVTIVEKKMTREKARKLAKTLTKGKWTHDYPITCEEARKLGLNINTQMPKEIYKFMDLFPQPRQARPAVQYVPVPYPPEPKSPSTD